MKSLRYCDEMRLFFILSVILVSFSASFDSPKESNNEQDRTALVALRDGFLSGDTPPDGSALSSWNSSFHFCDWQGVTCGKRHKRVTEISLAEQKLVGVLRPSIGNLTFLRVLDLKNSSLHSEEPKEIGQLRRLRYINLAQNFFEGQIPVELSNCSNLREMHIFNNNFSGLIPFQFGSLSKLAVLLVNGSNLVGQMPNFLRNLSSLVAVDLGNNHFHGEIQNSLKGLPNLIYLSLYSNNFSGSISPLYNLSSLEILNTYNNLFTGALAKDMDVEFPKATFLNFANNNFIGAIPFSLSNISGLTNFEITGNGLTGRVPDNLGKLKYLYFLQLSNNHLGGSEESNDLNFLDSLTNCTKLKGLIINGNRFGGQHPGSIANFSSSLQLLGISDNYITGPIPEGIGELSGLSVISFSFNLLDGVIPDSIGKLGNLSQLYLNENKLGGGIPSSIGNLTKLSILNMGRNSLNGNIPSTLRNCTGMEAIKISGNHFTGNLPDDLFTQFQNLWSCDISRNSFDGIFPLGVGKLGVLNRLFIYDNNLYGQIPNDLGESVQLEYLIMAGNSFEGSIPASLGRLRSLLALGLSDNNLSGPIPKDIANIASLQYLNLSFNKLKGEVPFFINASAVSVAGNRQLCGGNPELHLPTCKKGGILSRKAVIAICLSAFTSFSLFLIVCIFYRNRRKHKKGDVDSLTERYKRVTYTELFKATDGFAESNLIGTGSFGDVYRAVILHQNERKSVAVKVLKLSKHKATESFTTECKVLRRIRHRNLLSVITSCSSLDNKGNDFKALVFEFMSNGTLDNWLHLVDRHQEIRVLTLAKRLEIAIDVGCALDYLHNGCERPIVHCDLKPSNILLDDDMVAHVGDFGLAKLLLGDFSGGESMSTALRGSIGYIAPEYGMGAAISPLGDIYSYGILLLELVTGRRATDDIFNDEMSLQSFCERGLPDHVEEIVDQSLVGELYEVTLTRTNPEETKLQYHAFLNSFVAVGISCAAESPRDRMDIQSAIQSLKRVKEKYDSILA